ncbi:hypothetical protein LTR08_006504 [Meristemomyces frigidus]|nr:hypothetical protein LTR08_006504 [Meristemomyces frigidus]
MPSAASKPKRSRTSTTSQRDSQALQKTDVTIKVYDLLPPGRLSSLLWTFGGSLLHSGVVIRGREYAYGGHNIRGVTGVYWTRPNFVPPGGTWRCDILQGFTFHTQQEIDAILKEVSDEFLGERYNLLTNNCNHFTSALCEKLTRKAAPAWLNRAASIGLALPCMVPRDWVKPPDHETAEGELLDEEEDEDERAAMLQSDQKRRDREEWRRMQKGDVQKGIKREDDKDAEEMGSSLAGGRRIMSSDGTPPPRLVNVKDTSGREMPVAERAPLPKRPA